MGDQTPIRQDGPQSDAGSSPPNITPASDLMTASPSAAQQLENVEKVMSGFEKSTLRWARTAVIMSGLAAIFVCAQWWEMHQGGIDTHDLAQAAQGAAKAASDQADAAQQFSDTADEINGNINDAVGKLDAQARASQKANKQTVDLFKLRNRPWVGVEDDVVFDEANINWAGAQGEAEVRKEAAEDRLPMRVLYHLKNSGDSPALNTMLVIQPITFTQRGSDEAQINSSIEKACEIAEHRITLRNGDLLLPGGKHTVPYQFGQWDSTKFLFTPGCIVYRDVDGGFHHTRICYAVAMFVTPRPKGLESCQDQSAD